MKCPSCNSLHPYKDGMKCKCGYNFVLNPKEAPYFSDTLMKATIDKLSGNGLYYFTRNQLYSALYKRRLQTTRKTRLWVGGFISLGILLLLSLMSFNVYGKKEGFFVSGFAFLLFVFIMNRLSKTSPKFMGDIFSLIDKYHQVHPIKNMATGKAFQNLKEKKFDKSFFEHAPERILIVEHDDFTDVLLLNNFYFDEKCLVLSENKYPNRIFQAYQEFIEKHPDIPIHIMHDASERGFKMEERLRSDSSWKLSGKTILDMGIKKEDVEVLGKQGGFWIGKDKKEVSVHQNMEENMKKGYMVPMDFAPPLRMSGILAGSMLMGAGIGLAAQSLNRKGETVTDRGFG
ncbi:MAG: hypothetical protein H7A25_00835 [Leptospiraceae bacterium]|nr:hypothetical protein [Leptospiraceae bacterium]MCP5498422.1 hypothetical protein [Leptospiraceae bacterium]